MFTSKDKNELRIKDLKEGDVATILYSNVEHIVFIFRKSPGEPLKMVSLNYKGCYWDSPSSNGGLVVKLWKKGETLLIN